MPGSGSGCVAPQGEAQVRRELTLIASSCERLSATIGALEDRLCTVLRSEPPRPLGEQEVSASVPLATELRVTQDSVQASIFHIEDIMERLEL